MSKTIKGFFPPPEVLLQLEAEEIGIIILRFLNEHGSDSQLNRHNFTLSGNFSDYCERQDRIQVLKVVAEGWDWLEREGFLSLTPDKTGGWVFITRAGYRFLDSLVKGRAFNAAALEKKDLDPELKREVLSSFIRGEYDTAVFQAYKLIEVRVREAAGYGNEVIGTDLMRKAFHPTKGPLRDMGQESGERHAVSDLFSGAIGLFKNPQSHRNVNLDDPDEVAELIYFCNQLLRILARRVDSVG